MIVKLNGPKVPYGDLETGDAFLFLNEAHMVISYRDDLSSTLWAVSLDTGVVRNNIARETPVEILDAQVVRRK